MNRRTSAWLSRREFLAASVAASGVAALFAAGGAAAQEHTPAAGHTTACRACCRHGSRRKQRSGGRRESDGVRSDRVSRYDFDWGQESLAPDGRTVREWDGLRGRQGDRGGAGRLLSGLDLQRPGAGAHVPLPAGRPAAFPLPQRLLYAAHDSFPRHPSTEHGRRDAGGPDRRRLRLRVRGQAVRAAPVSLPRHAPEAAHPQGAVRRLSSSIRPRAARRRGKW